MAQGFGAYANMSQTAPCQFDPRPQRQGLNDGRQSRIRGGGQAFREGRQMLQRRRFSVAIQHGLLEGGQRPEQGVTMPARLAIPH